MYRTFSKYISVSEQVMQTVKTQYACHRSTHSPYGDGRAAERIVSLVQSD
jgi:UDP-N-acetylglucosamine 2-epimerase